MIELRIGKSVDASILNHFEPYSPEYEFYYSVVNSSALLLWSISIFQDEIQFFTN
jgi:hypothetical protein